MLLTRMLLFLGLAISWSGCGDMIIPEDPPVGSPGLGYDAAPLEPTPLPPDAGVPDALAIDAPPPWEPTAPILPDDPCEIVSDIPEAMYDARMANYSVRFRDGMGLEQSPDLRQAGLLEVENADVDKRDAVEKRLGADLLGDARSTTPGDVVSDASRRALWVRGNETILQTNDSIYSLKPTGSLFTWRRVEPWTQGKLREQYANYVVSGFNPVVQVASRADLGEQTLVAADLGSNTVSFSRYTGTTRESQQNFNSAEIARLAQAGDRVLLAYKSQATGTLFADTFVAGDESVTPANTGFSSQPNRDYDIAGMLLDTGNHVFIYATEDAGGNVFSINIVADTRTANHSIVTGNTNTGDVNVTIWPLDVAGDIRYAITTAGINVGVNQAVTRVFELPSVAGAPVLLATITSTMSATTRSVAASWESFDKLWIAVEEDNAGLRRVKYFRGDAAVPVSAGVLSVTHEATALVSQGVIGSGTPTNGVATDLLSPMFVEQLLIDSSVSSSVSTPIPSVNRSGWIMFAPRTQEVIARSYVGYTGDLATRTARPAKGSLIVEDGSVSWAGPVASFSDPDTNLISIGMCRVSFEASANNPAQDAGTSISAHAGYPRAYDGTQAFEHDWHSIPIIRDPITVVGPGAIPSGMLMFAAQWEWTDANDIRYRSAPAFLSREIVAGQTATSFTVTVDGALTHTERANVNLVIWRTTSGGATLYRALTTPASSLSTQTVSVTINETDLVRQEVIDQAQTQLGQGIVESRPARVTDFISFGIDRAFSRDPLKGALLRFTIPSREATGFAMHWPLAFAVEEPDERDVTGVAEMDGRIVVGSELGLALLTADGPDATGAGSFGTPTILRAEQGIKNQEVLARTPIGYAFGTRSGEPMLLSPGLTVEDLAKQVERAYKIDGTNIVSIAYDQNREEMVFLANSGKTLRLNTSTGRWASDPNRLGRDLTVTKDGTLYLIRADGKVLKQREDVWADGGVGYALKVSTPWIRDMAKDGTTHSSFRLGAVYVSGEYLGPHDLFFDVYKDFDDTVPWGTFQVPEATVVANAAANRGWIYGIRLGGRDSFLAARVVVRDGAEPNRTFRLAQMDIDIETNGSSKYAELQATHYAAVV